LASIGALTFEKDIMKQVMPPEQSFTQDYAGIFHFRVTTIPVQFFFSFPFYTLFLLFYLVLLFVISYSFGDLGNGLMLLLMTNFQLILMNYFL